MDNYKELLKNKIKERGLIFPKKHGKWFVLNVFKNTYLVLDSWNGSIYYSNNGCNNTGLDNLYRVVYTFEDDKGIVISKTVNGHLFKFFYGHI